MLVAPGKPYPIVKILFKSNATINASTFHPSNLTTRSLFSEGIEPLATLDSFIIFSEN